MRERIVTVYTCVYVEIVYVLIYAISVFSLSSKWLSVRCLVLLYVACACMLLHATCRASVVAELYCRSYSHLLENRIINSIIKLCRGTWSGTWLCCRDVSFEKLWCTECSTTPFWGFVFWNPLLVYLWWRVPSSGGLCWSKNSVVEACCKRSSAGG